MLTRRSPIPPKRQRERSGIERAPKREWPRHRKFVRSHSCCVPGCSSLGVPDVAHLRGINNCGTSLKPHDWFTVPLCRHHHLEQEPIGPDAFGDRHGIDLWEIADKLVQRSPDNKMRVARAEAMLDDPHQFRPSVKPGGQDKTASVLADRIGKTTPSAGGVSTSHVNIRGRRSPLRFIYFPVSDTASVPLRVPVIMVVGQGDRAMFERRVG
jgi:hypothetical protein